MIFSAGSATPLLIALSLASSQLVIWPRKILATVVASSFSSVTLGMLNATAIGEM